MKRVVYIHEECGDHVEVLVPWVVFSEAIPNMYCHTCQRGVSEDEIEEEYEHE